MPVNQNCEITLIRYSIIGLLMSANLNSESFSLIVDSQIYPTPRKIKGDQDLFRFIDGTREVGVEQETFFWFCGGAQNKSGKVAVKLETTLPYAV